MIKSLVQKYIVSKINGVLTKNKDDVQKVCSIVDTWTKRLVKISSLFASISARCADGKLDDDEVTKTMEEIDTIVKEF